MKKLLIIDRDGTIIIEPPDQQIDSIEKLSFIDGVLTNLAQIVKEFDYDLVMVTNQDGLGTDSFPEDHFWPAHSVMLDKLKERDIVFREVLIDRSFEKDNAPTRKPQTGLMTSYLEGNYDLKNSFVIGDRLTDVEFAKNLGCRGIWIKDVPSEEERQLIKKKELGSVLVLTTTSWEHIYRFLAQSNS
ncbi:MAG: histidinol-phosphatase [Candidatus Omnitrophica bacterium]|nr:histidinol-phosphatase [Candidatus Omnitrophota bacterium]